MGKYRLGEWRCFMSSDVLGKGLGFSVKGLGRSLGSIAFVA